MSPIPLNIIKKFKKKEELKNGEKMERMDINAEIIIHISFTFLQSAP